MIGIDEEITKAQEKCKATIKLLEMIDARKIEAKISHVTDDTMFAEPVNTVDEFKQLLRDLGRTLGRYTEMHHYYADSNKTLCCSYRFDAGFDIAIYCRDAKGALELVSGGRCRFEEETKKEIKVVCDLQP